MKVKVVYVVLEAQYQAALTQTVKRINDTNTKVSRHAVLTRPCSRPAGRARGRAEVRCRLLCQHHSCAILTHTCLPPLLTAAQVCFEIVGYLLEELRDSSNYDAFKEDVATANVFIGSLIFIEELADKVSSG